MSLTFLSYIDNTSKQGIVGLCKREKDRNNEEVVFKISRYLNFLIYHEYIVMKGLMDLRPYCPHYCALLDILSLKVNSEYKDNKKDPFKVTDKSLEHDVLFSSYISDSNKLSSYIKSDNITDDVLISTVKQTMIAIQMAQEKKNFSHYDLHSNNILMKRCNKDMVFLYVLSPENVYCVPTYGHYPVILIHLQHGRLSMLA